MISNIIFLLLGTVLTLIAGIIASKLKQRQLLTDKLLDYYFDARKEIVEIVCKLADLQVKRKLIDDERDNYRESVATQYFKYLDFLPIQVLDSLLSLHACLLVGGERLFQVKNNSVVEIPRSDYIKFVDQFARFRNTRLYARFALNSKDNNVRQNLAIKLHAQYVLHNLNKFASIEKLLSIPKGSRKRTGL